MTYKKGDRDVKVEGSVNGNNIEYRRISRKEPKLETTKVIKNMDVYLKDLNDTLGGDDTDGSKTLFIMRDSDGVLMYKILTVTLKSNPKYTLSNPFNFNVDEKPTTINLGPMDADSEFNINFVTTIHAYINNDSHSIQFFGNNNLITGAYEKKFTRERTGAIRKRITSMVSKKRSSESKKSLEPTNEDLMALYSVPNKPTAPSLPPKKSATAPYKGNGHSKFTK